MRAMIINGIPNIFSKENTVVVVFLFHVLLINGKTAPRITNKAPYTGWKYGILKYT